MKLSTPLAFAAFLFISVTVFESECCGGGSGGGGGGDSSSSSSSSSSDSYEQTPRGKKKSFDVLIGKTGIRGRDKTGHRTGLGTIAKSAVKDPVKTAKAAKAFIDNYNDMKAKNIRGGNLPAHEKANKEATEVSSKKLAAGISALREQSKRGRISIDKSGIRYGDTRTDKETKDTMDANRRGREQAGR